MAIRTAHENDIAARKRAAACAAVAEIEDGMLVGLGTGTTANFAIAALGERVAAGLKVTTVATSLAAGRAAEAAGLPVLPFDTLARLDLAIDGADELDPQLRAIKGKGGAMLREKIVAAAADAHDRDRRRRQAGDQARPRRRFQSRCCRSRPVSFLIASSVWARRVSLRMAGDASYRTDQDNMILDCRFGSIDDPQALASALSAIPGMLGHGLFLDEIDAAYVGGSDGVIQLTRGAS